MNRKLAGKTVATGARGFALQRIAVSKIYAHAIERRHAGGAGSKQTHGTHKLEGKSESRRGVARGSAKRGGQILRTPRQPREARVRRGCIIAECEQRLRRLGRNDEKLCSSGRSAKFFFQRRQQTADRHGLTSGRHFGQHDAIRSARHHDGEVIGELAAGERVYAHPKLQRGALLMRREEVAHTSSRLGQELRGHGILKIEDERIGTAGARLVVLSGVVTGYEEPRTNRGDRTHEEGLFSMSAARRQEATSSPSWLKARCSKVTMPESDRERLSRLASTTVSARKVSPMRTGNGNLTSSQPRFPKVVPYVVSYTDSPTKRPRVKTLFTMRSPNTVPLAYSASRCSAAGFMVRALKRRLSVSVTVRRTACSNRCPTSNCSK